MGLIHTFLEIAASRTDSQKSRVRFLVDSGAEYSVVPRKELNSLGIKPYRQVSVILTDGTVLKREAGEAFFSYQGESATSPVLLGEPDDEALLGAVTLESLGLILDPLKRRMSKRRVFRM